MRRRHGNQLVLQKLVLLLEERLKSEWKSKLLQAKGTPQLTGVSFNGGEWSLKCEHASCSV
jgi:hypothetical protein